MKKNNLFLIIIILIALVSASLYIVLRDSSSDTLESNESIESRSNDTNITANTNPELLDEKLISGNPDADVVIVEYIDYKCPNCNRFHRGTGKDIASTYGDQVVFEIRAYPVIGPDSANALRGAYCANDQDAFEQYHDRVMNYMWDNYYEARNYAVEFDNILTTEKLVNIMSDTSLDVEVFTDCVNSDTKNELLDRDLLLAADHGIQGTPGFALAGQSFIGLQPQSVFDALIEKELSN